MASRDPERGSHCHRAVEAGDLDDVPIAPLARLLIAMLTEASLEIGRAESPAPARVQFGIVLDRLLAGLTPRR